MQMEMKLASESHVPRFRAGVGTWRSGYMIPIRLPWRHRARPSATLHEIQGLPRKLRSKLVRNVTRPTEVRQPDVFAGSGLLKLLGCDWLRSTTPITTSAGFIKRSESLRLWEPG